MPILTQGAIQIESAIPIASIHNFHMELQENAHAYVWLEGMVSEEEGEECLLRPMAGTRLTVKADNRLLFEGMLKEAQMKQDGMEYQVFMIGVSYTERLDYQKKCRTFQNTSMTYQEVMKQVLADVPDARLQFYEADRAIGAPLYQMEETDWAFLKRLAGRLHTGIAASVYSAVPAVYVGIPNGGKREADSETVCEEIWYDRERRSTCMYVRTGDNWEIGDRTDWQNREFTVTGKKCRLENGLLQFYYTLMERPFLKTDIYENPYMTGLFLSATVLDVREEQVRVKFDVDKEQPLEDAYWYPWEPDMGNLTYCMPEKGERVYVRIGDAAGYDARAVCGVRGNGAGHPEMVSSHRYFTTKDRKRMYLTPDAIGFRDLKQKKILQAELKDDTGASLISPAHFTITAKENVGLKGDHILFQAPQEISLVKKAVSPTVLNMCNGFDLIGAADSVVMEGSGEDEFPFFSQEEQSKTGFAFREPERMAACIIGSTPTVELEDRLLCKLEGCQVKQLGRSSLL